MSQEFTIGIEEEFQIVDPETRDLRSHVVSDLEEGRRLLGEQVKPELHQCMVEVGTGIARTSRKPEGPVQTSVPPSTTSRAGRGEICRRFHASIRHWSGQKITDHRRYMQIVERPQVLSRSLLIFGLHVHVGVEDREMAIHIMNAARYFFAHTCSRFPPVPPSGWACKRG